MRSFLLTFFLIAFVMLPVSGGTYFGMAPDGKAHCKGDMSESFSIFLEGEDAWGEYSEYHVVCTRAGMRLDFFEQSFLGVKEGEGLQAYLLTDTVLARLSAFLGKLETVPNLATIAVYDPRKATLDSMFRLRRSKCPAEQVKAQWAAYDRLQKTILNDTASPYYLLPGDHGYLRKGHLGRDLRQMITLLKCYKAAGIRRVRITYG